MTVLRGAFALGSAGYELLRAAWGDGPARQCGEGSRLTASGISQDFRADPEMPFALARVSSLGLLYQKPQTRWLQNTFFLPALEAGVAGLSVSVLGLGRGPPGVQLVCGVCPSPGRAPVCSWGPILMTSSKPNPLPEHHLSTFALPL